MIPVHSMSWAESASPSLQAPSYTYPSTMSPAYTPVSVRQGFGQAYTPQSDYYASSTNSFNSPTMAPSSSDQQPQQQKFDWPDSVRSYVQRSFQSSNVDPSVSDTEIKAKLKETIRYTQDCGTMYTTDWDNMPLPQVMIKTQRRQELMQSAAAPPTVAESDRPTTVSASSNPKKRKSSDLSGPEPLGTTTVPWRSGKTLEDRITKPSNTMDSPLAAKSKFQKNAEKRLRRGDGGYQSTYRSPSPPLPTGPIVGLNENLEKRYLRLTAAPKPSDVRPEHVLHKTLDLLKKKWRKDGNYNYICDQFKSLRQDLTVQRIKNEFTVSVYEIHARIALEKGDLGEYNQCQTQLRALYRAGVKGNAIEFKAYRILYFIHTANRTALNDAIADLTAAEKEEIPIKHALSVRSALALGNYHKFFQLYLDVPNMGAYLIDMFVKRERLAALANMCKAFKPDLKLRYISEELGFESDTEAAQFIIDHAGHDMLQERPDHVIFLTGKAGQLFEEARAEAFRRVDLKGQI